LATVTDLEFNVMDVLWTTCECSVSEMVCRLDRQLPYTTVLSALDRLHAKGLTTRRRHQRAFIYAPNITREEWHRQEINQFVNGLLVQQPSGELLVSCLVEALTQTDISLLEELEAKIAMRRNQPPGG